MFFFPEGSAEGRGEGRWGDKQERVGTWITTREEEQRGKTTKEEEIHLGFSEKLDTIEDNNRGE